MIKLSLVIPCSRPKMAYQLLKSIEKDPLSKNLEIFVSGDLDSRLTETNWNLAVTFINEKNKHPNVRRNNGIYASKTPWVAFLDDDTELSESWIETALHCISKNELKVYTGPEKNLRNNKTSQSLYTVCRSYWAEFSKCHYYFEQRQVHWDEVPFCNCLVPKKFLSGGLNINIPWNIDDFHFFSGLSKVTSFENNPNLLIKHDRYPESFRSFFKYKWNLRKKTGENFIHHFSLYWKIPAITLAALTLPALVLISYTSTSLLRTVIVLTILIYFIVLLMFVSENRKNNDPTTLQSLCVLIGLHSITFFGLHFGILAGILQKIGVVQK